MNCFVGHRQQVVGGFDVANRSVQIDRLDWVAAVEVNDVENLCQFEQILKIGAGAGVANAVEADEVRGAGHRAEGHPIAADVEGVRGVSCMQFEFAWASFNSFKHHFRIKTHALIFDFRAGLL